GFLMGHTYFTSNPAGLLTRRLGTAANAPLLTLAPEFDYTANFGPRVLLGVASASGIGLRAGWWRLDEGAAYPTSVLTDPTLRTQASSVPVAGVPGFTAPGALAQQFKVFADQLAFDNHLKLDVYDLEGFKEFAGGSWSFLVAGGCRYGDLSQSYRAFRFNSG